ncbi:hypothetical protein [Zooshikella ganghwensis]|uniref:Phage tail tape measure protein n=1 Tax=Zooshikella ganghwensis TaxID=202772 RepID=A0A4P9VV91_9GAMM|nr:hypothetical protein [Zooshikella ganghwensis]RDH45820.1 hypothetical protein B9G39_21525 [Zooshikella ganghwensis]
MSKLALNIAIGAFLDKSLGKSIKKSQASAAKLGKAYRETNKQLAAVKDLNKYKNKLSELKAKQANTTQSSHRLAEGIKNVERQYRSAKRSAKKYGIEINNVAKAQKKLQRKAALQKFGNKMMPGLGKAATGLKRGAGIATGGIAGLFGLSAWTASRLDPIAKTADKLGFGIEALQEFQYAAERSGVSLQQFNIASQRMIRRVAEAAQGTGEAKNALAELGLSAQWLGKLKPEQQYEQIAEAMSQVKNQNDRVRLAMKLFDSKGVDLVDMLKDGRQGLQALRADARATGNVLGEQALRDAENFTDAMFNAQQAMGGVKNTIGAGMMPAFTQLMKHFKSWVVSYLPKIQTLVKDISQRLLGWAKNMYQLGQGFFKVTGIISNFISTTIGWKNLGYILAGLMGVKLFMSIMTFGKAVLSLIPIIKAVGAAFLMNPIGLAVTAIAGGAALIITYWEPIKSFFSGLWNSIKSTFSGAWNLIKGIFNKSPLGMLLKHWKPGFDWLVSKFSWIKDVISSVFDWFGDDDEDKKKNAKPNKHVASQRRGRSRGIRYGTTKLSEAKARNSQYVQAQLRQRSQQIKVQNQSRTQVNAPITISTQPGQDNEEIAKRVRAELERREFEAQSEQRAALYDQDGLAYAY